MIGLRLDTDPHVGEVSSRRRVLLELGTVWRSGFLKAPSVSVLLVKKT